LKMKHIYCRRSAVNGIAIVTNHWDAVTCKSCLSRREAFQSRRPTKGG
jgi:hypothetical protein